MLAQVERSTAGTCPSGWQRLAALPSGPLPEEQFLRLALGICDALIPLHRAESCYGQLAPETVFVCPATSQVQLAGVGPAEPLLDHDMGVAPAGPQLPYLAPEQSGRINQRLDARSDCYSLGVIFYQLLTGSPPFEANDALEWVHAHLARKPQPPNYRNASVPAPLSDIVMKMLEKSPEHRYQGIAGLQADLAQCWQQWISTGTIAPFAIGHYDVAGGLGTLHRLYGRDKDLAAMSAAYRRVAEQCTAELLLVSGPAGVGKSAVVGELEKVVNADGGAFIAGKFDQYTSQTPYATLCGALSQLVQVLLSGDEATLRAYRGRLDMALAGNGALLHDLIAHARLLLGEQPPPPALPPKEAQRRFFSTLRSFIVTFSERPRPLVIFLDDLQWTDQATLSFLHYLLVDTATPNLLVIGSYRDNEITVSHPLTAALERYRASGLAVTDLRLAPLSKDDFATMLADVLGIGRAAALPLAALVHKKTAGIPLFAQHFLGRLEHEGHLRHNPATSSWQWDIDAINAQAYSDNVIDLMLDAIKVQLPEKALGLLQYAACIGYLVALPLLARSAARMTENAARTLLREALAAGFIDLIDRHSIRFAHDRIRQAVYATIPRARRAAIHLEIARLLLASQARGAINERVFDIADQFNLGGPDIAGDDERRQLMEINLRAGTRAKAAGAHASASHYLGMGLRHFRPGDFDTDYPTAYWLYFEKASCCYLLDQTEEAGDLLEQLLQHTQGIADRARALHLKIELLMAKGNYTEAFAALDECTRLFGIELSPDVTAQEANAEEAKFWDAIAGRPLASLADVPAKGDEAYEFLLDSLLIAMPLAHVWSDHLFHVMVAHAANLGLQHGNTGECAMAYALLGYICCFRDEIDKASGLEKLALQLVSGPVPERYRAPVLLVTGGLIGPFTRPLRMALSDLHSSFESGKLSDEPVAANLACQYIIEQRCSLGDPLADVLQDAQSRLDFAKRTAYTPTRPVLEAWRSYIRNQRGETTQLLSFDSDDFNERALEAELDTTAGSPLHFVYYSLKLQARFRFGDFANASVAAAKAGLYARFGRSALTAEFHLYQALTAAALCSSVEAGGAEWQRQRDVLRAGCARLAAWNRHCPDNFSARCYLADAELARIDGDTPRAIDLYMRAIEAAHAQGTAQITALAHELAARFCRAHGLARLADTLLSAAMVEYARWGAVAKVEQLRQRDFPDQAMLPAARAVSLTPAGQLDLLTVAKAAQSVSSEVTTGRLHETLLRTLLEQVGAQCAHLLVYRHGQMQLKESARYEDNHFYLENIEALPATADRVPEMVVNYVARARAPLVLDDACREGVFVQDPYFRDKQQCAVLCMPVLRRNELIGVLYLENRQLAGAFSRVNLQVLEWLLAQVAISMENAGLYQDLQQSEGRLAAVMENVPACVYMKDPQGRYLYVNREFERMFAVSLADILRKTDHDFLQDQPEVVESIHKADMIAIRGSTISVEENLFAADGAPHTFLSVKTPLRANNEITGLCGISMDISEQKRARERIDYLAQYDVLTGLPNRHLLADRITLALAEARRMGTQVGLLVLDMDRFKVINDSLGHRVGDLLLQEVAVRLKTCVRDGDTVARLGGDAFVIIATGLAGGELLRPLAFKIFDSLLTPFHLDGHRATASACIGISLFPRDASDGDSLLQFAEMAMYHAKEQGTKSLRFYDEAMDKRAQERLAMENELRSAFANKELYLLYQPQVNLRDRHVIGAEALMRWRHPVRGMISPARFIPLAEECGLITELTEWAINQVCAQLRTWKDSGLPDISLAVNVSARNVQYDDLYTWVASALSATGLAGSSLELEMTEGTLMTDMEASIEKLVELKRLGIRTSIDDFGTGYSSLSYLKRLPVDKLKIDQSFVRDIAQNPNDAAITGAIIAMGRQLNLKVIAEGVEDTDAERFLLKHRCDQMQGYLFSPPVPADVFAGMLSHS
jgi:diguanylate cyclase (GGDEF)-like protein/PAS domain S-box-containing protein